MARTILACPCLATRQRCFNGQRQLSGFHRLCLWLEERGWLYYKHKKPGSTAAGSFAAAQNVLEPPARHVIQVKEEKRYHGAEAAGPDERGGEEAAGAQKPA